MAMRSAGVAQREIYSLCSREWQEQPKQKQQKQLKQERQEQAEGKSGRNQLPRDLLIANQESILGGGKGY